MLVLAYPSTISRIFGIGQGAAWRVPQRAAPHGPRGWTAGEPAVESFDIGAPSGQNIDYPKMRWFHVIL